MNYTWASLEEKIYICHIHNYTEYNQQWNLFSAFNPSKCTHTWSSGQSTLQHPGSSWGFGALLKGLTSVVDNSCRRRYSNPQPLVTSPMLYPLVLAAPIVGHHCICLLSLSCVPTLLISCVLCCCHDHCCQGEAATRERKLKPEIL